MPGGTVVHAPEREERMNRRHRGGRCPACAPGSLPCRRDPPSRAAARFGRRPAATRRRARRCIGRPPSRSRRAPGAPRTRSPRLLPLHRAARPGIREGRRRTPRVSNALAQLRECAWTQRQRPGPSKLSGEELNTTACESPSWPAAPHPAGSAAGTRSRCVRKTSPRGCPGDESPRPPSPAPGPVRHTDRATDPPSARRSAPRDIARSRPPRETRFTPSQRPDHRRDLGARRPVDPKEAARRRQAREPCRSDR